MGEEGAGGKIGGDLFDCRVCFRNSYLNDTENKLDQSFLKCT